jgi:1-aminocyclopropane-1-carboxylate deaminase
MHLAFENITVDPIDLFIKKGIHVSVLRLDKLHPVVSGNKWFKLRYYLEDARLQQKKKIVTFGGAWSNHIVAVAAACQLHGFASAGIIRGEEPRILSRTLANAKNYGMELHFISRDDYSQKTVPRKLEGEENYFINEGGYGEKGAEGAATILEYAKNGFTHFCCAVGTGTMMAGLINGGDTRQEVIGISVLKNNKDLEPSVGSLLGSERKQWQIIHDYHFGGYAKHTPGLIAFMNDFYGQTGIPSDFVYTGKLFYAVTTLINDKFFPTNSRLLLIHSGGLQGNTSLEKGTLIF